MRDFKPGKSTLATVEKGVRVQGKVSINATAVTGARDIRRKYFRIRATDWRESPDVIRMTSVSVGSVLLGPVHRF